MSKIKENVKEEFFFVLVKPYRVNVNPSFGSNLKTWSHLKKIHYIFI